MRVCGDCGSPASACICRDYEPPTAAELSAWAEDEAPAWAEYHPEPEPDDDDEGDES